MDENCLQLELESRCSALPSARRALRAWLTLSRLSHQEREDFVLAVSEVLANAVIHSNRRQPARRVTLTGQLDETGRSVWIGVQDEGGSLIQTPDAPDPLAESGRGLRLAHQLVDELVLGAQPGLVLLRKTAAASEPL